MTSYYPLTLSNWTLFNSKFKRCKRWVVEYIWLSDYIQMKEKLSIKCIIIH